MVANMVPRHRSDGVNPKSKDIFVFELLCSQNVSGIVSSFFKFSEKLKTWAFP